MYLVLSAFTSSPVSFASTTKASAFSLTVCALPPNILTSIGRESLKFFCVLGFVAYLQVSPVGGSREETWRGQGIRKSSVAWNLPKLSQL